ncbi:hypothetical protein Q9966_013330 [Columba livia]|nr:hypothetical protein Q9966_013330 [Columba livia]
MEETNTTELYMDYMSLGYVDYGESIAYECSPIPYGLKIFGAVCMGISLCGLVGNILVILLDSSYHVDVIYLDISSLLALLNSSVNPFIYFLVGSWRQCRFQRSVKVAFRRLFEERVTSEEENHEPGDTTAVTTL